MTILAAQTLEELVRPYGTVHTGITFVAEDTWLSYDELARRAAAGANRLRQAGVTPGSVVAMTVTNDVASVVAALAVWSAGCTLASMPPQPHQAPPAHGEQFVRVLRGMGSEVFLTDGDTPESLRILRGLDKAWLAEPGPAGPECTAAGTALIQFTSGSVGVPKGVAVSADRLVGHLDACARFSGYERGRDRFYSWLPLYHDMGLVAMVLNAMARRLEMTLSDPRSFALRPSTWLAGVAKSRATVTGGPNFAYRLAAQVPYDGLDLSSVRQTLVGGERVHWPSLLDFHQATAPFGLRWEALAPSYGLAEGVVAVTSTPMGRGPVLGPGGHVSVGVPLSGVDIHAANDVPGQIHIGGSRLFDGYHTSAGFEPFEGEQFDTGDDGFWHDGELYVLGRRAEVITAAGRNIFAEDVESAVLQAGAPYLRACAAFRYGSELERFALLVELNARTGAPDDAVAFGRSIRDAVRTSLGVRVSPVIVAKTGAIPRTTSGKVQRAQSREAYTTGRIARRLIAEIN